MKPNRESRIFLFLSALLLVACGSKEPQTVADVIYAGGPIITANDAQPTAEAVAVSDGTILFVGSAADVEKYRGTDTVDIDLAGRTLSPGFIDGHAHVAQFGVAGGWCQLAGRT